MFNFLTKELSGWDANSTSLEVGEVGEAFSIPRRPPSTFARFTLRTRRATFGRHPGFSGKRWSSPCGTKFPSSGIPPQLATFLLIWTLKVPWLFCVERWDGSWGDLFRAEIVGFIQDDLVDKSEKTNEGTTLCSSNEVSEWFDSVLRYFGALPIHLILLSTLPMVLVMLSLSDRHSGFAAIKVANPCTFTCVVRALSMQRLHTWSKNYLRGADCSG